MNLLLLQQGCPSGTLPLASIVKHLLQEPISPVTAALAPPVDSLEGRPPGDSFTRDDSRLAVVSRAQKNRRTARAIFARRGGAKSEPCKTVEADGSSREKFSPRWAVRVAQFPLFQ